MMLISEMAYKESANERAVNSHDSCFDSPAFSASAGLLYCRPPDNRQHAKDNGVQSIGISCAPNNMKAV